MWPVTCVQRIQHGTMFKGASSECWKKSGILFAAFVKLRVPGAEEGQHPRDGRQKSDSRFTIGKFAGLPQNLVARWPSSFVKETLSVRITMRSPGVSGAAVLYRILQHGDLFSAEWLALKQLPSIYLDAESALAARNYFFGYGPDRPSPRLPYPSAY